MANHFVDFFGEPFGLGSSDEAKFGRKPDYNFQSPDLATAQKQAISANQAALPASEKYGNDVNLYNRDQLHSMLTAGMPDLDQITKNISHNILDQTAGKVPSDLADMLTRRSAEMGVGGRGFGGFSQNQLLKSFGLSSMAIRQQGQSNAEQWMSTAKNVLNAPLYDVGRMAISPAEQYSALMDKFQFDMLKENVAAAPDPVARGVFDTNLQMIGMAASYFGMKSNFQGPPQQAPAQSYQYMPSSQGPSYGPPQNTMSQPGGGNYGGENGFGSIQDQGLGGSDFGGGGMGGGDMGASAGMGGFM